MRFGGWLEDPWRNESCLYTRLAEGIWVSWSVAVKVNGKQRSGAYEGCLEAEKRVVRSHTVLLEHRHYPTVDFTFLIRQVSTISTPSSSSRVFVSLPSLL